MKLGNLVQDRWVEGSGSGRVLTLDSVKPLMDEWSELIGKFLEIET